MMTISVVERSGIWRVELNGRFYGDYVKQEWAKQAALEKAHQLRSAGECARVEMTETQTNITDR